MDQPEFPISTNSRAEEDANLEEEVQSLRILTTVLLFAILCMGAGISLYLYRQMAQLNIQVAESRRAVADYQTNALPRFRWFVGSLQNFAKTNQDFAPILSKYGLTPTNSAPPGANSPQKK